MIGRADMMYIDKVDGKNDVAFWSFIIWFHEVFM